MRDFSRNYCDYRGSLGGSVKQKGGFLPSLQIIKIPDAPSFAVLPRRMGTRIFPAVQLSQMQKRPCTLHGLFCICLICAPLEGG
jgi:hypothetical protein